MVFRFQRRLTILPGVRLNVSKSGVSLSLGPRGASVSIGRGGVFANAGLPGTGLSYRTKIGAAAARSSYAGLTRSSADIPDSASDESQAYLERLAGLLYERERENIDWSNRALHALHPPPDDEESFEEYARTLASSRFARRMVEVDRAAWAEVLYTELSNEELPFEFSFNFAIDDDSGQVRIKIELPAEDVVPLTASRVTRSGSVVSRPLPKAFVRDLYEDVCCALLLRVAHEVYRVIPEADELFVEGARATIDRRTGADVDAVLLRFATDRSNFSVIDLDRVDPSHAFEHLGGASSKSRGLLVPLEIRTGVDPNSWTHDPSG